MNNSNTKGNQAFAKRMCLPSQELELETYEALKLNRDIHLALEYEKQNLSIKGQWQTSPKLKGMSGGALIKVSGVSLSLDKKTIKKPKHLLSGVIISSKVEKKGKPGALIGTRIEVHLQLISKFLPKL